MFFLYSSYLSFVLKISAKLLKIQIQTNDRKLCSFMTNKNKVRSRQETKVWKRGFSTSTELGVVSEADHRKGQ